MLRDSLSDLILHCIDANPVEGKNSNDENIVAHREPFPFSQIKPGHDRHDVDEDIEDDGDSGQLGPECLHRANLKLILIVIPSQ